MELARNFDRELDARGLNCPLPILRTKKALNDMQTGNALIEHSEADGIYRFYLQRK